MKSNCFGCAFTTCSHAGSSESSPCFVEHLHYWWLSWRAGTPGARALLWREGWCGRAAGTPSSLLLKSRWINSAQRLLLSLAQGCSSPAPPQKGPATRWASQMQGAEDSTAAPGCAQPPPPPSAGFFLEKKPQEHTKSWKEGVVWGMPSVESCWILVLARKKGPLSWHTQREPRSCACCRGPGAAALPSSKPSGQGPGGGCLVNVSTLKLVALFS